MADIPHNYSLADQVLINASAEIAAGRYALDDSRLAAAIESMKLVLPHVSREKRLIQKLAEASDDICDCFDQKKSRPDWSTAKFDLNMALAAIFHRRHGGAFQAWKQTPEAKT